MKDINQLIEEIHTANAAQRASEHSGFVLRRHWGYVAAAAAAAIALILLVPMGHNKAYAGTKTTTGITVYAASGTDADQVVREMEEIIREL